MTIEYIVSVPNYWDGDRVEFHRNEGSWCADNAIDELITESGNGCLCGKANFQYIEDVSGEFLNEK